MGQCGCWGGYRSPQAATPNHHQHTPPLQKHSEGSLHHDHESPLPGTSSNQPPSHDAGTGGEGDATAAATEGRGSKRECKKSLSLKLSPFLHSGDASSRLGRSRSLRLPTHTPPAICVDQTRVGTSRKQEPGSHPALRRTVSATGHNTKPVQKILRQPRRRHNTVRGVSGLSVRAHNTYHTYHTYHSNLI